MSGALITEEAIRLVALLLWITDGDPLGGPRDGVLAAVLVWAVSAVVPVLYHLALSSSIMGRLRMSVGMRLLAPLANALATAFVVTVQGEEGAMAPLVCVGVSAGLLFVLAALALVHTLGRLAGSSASGRREPA